MKRSYLLTKLEEIDFKIGEHNIGEISVKINKINKSFSTIVLYPHEKTLSSETLDNISNIMQNVAKGDKLAIQQILNSSDGTEFANFG